MTTTTTTRGNGAQARKIVMTARIAGANKPRHPFDEHRGKNAGRDDDADAEDCGFQVPTSTAISYHLSSMCGGERGRCWSTANKSWSTIAYTPPSKRTAEGTTLDDQQQGW